MGRSVLACTPSTPLLGVGVHVENVCTYPNKLKNDTKIYFFTELDT